MSMHTCEPRTGPPAPAPATDRGHYDSASTEYDRLIRPHYEAIAGMVVARVLELTDVRRADVVELSAGTGALTHQLAPMARSYLATDLSEPMLAVARRRGGAGTERVRWRRADVLATGLGTATADVVVSSLGPFQDTDTGIAEARRLLRHGGPLVASTWGDDYGELRLIQRARALLGLPARTVTSASALAARLRLGGLDDVVVRELRLPVVHASFEDYFAYRLSFGQAPGTTSENLAASRRALAAAAEPYLDRDGRVVLDWHVLVLSGRR